MFKKILKRFFKITGITLLVIILAAIILPFIFKDKILQKVKDEINNNVNAKVDFRDFGFTIFKNFPNFTLQLDSISVVGVQEFEGDTLASIKTLSASVNLMSVISGDKYEVNSITLDNPRIQVQVLKNGKASWDIAKPSTDTTKTDTAKSEPSSFKLGLKKLSINNAYIVYDDQQGGIYAKIVNLTHSLKGDLTSDFTGIESKTDIDALTFSFGGIQYMKNNKIAIKLDVDADLKNAKYTLKENEFKINELLLGIDGWVSMPKSDIDMDLKFFAQKTEFKNILSLIPAVFAKDFEKIQTSGKIALDGFAKGVFNEKNLPAFGVNILVENAMFKYPDLPMAVTNINIDTKINNKGGSPDNTEINVNKFHVEMGQNPVDIRVIVKTPVSDPLIDATMKGKLNLADVKNFYPLGKEEELNGLFTMDLSFNGRLSSIEAQKYDEFKALGNLGIQGLAYKSKDFPQGVTINTCQLAFSPQFVELVAFDSKFGKSDFSAKGKIDNLLNYVFKNELLKGKFETNSNLMNLNEFMGNSSETPQQTTTETSSTQMSVIEVPGNIDFILTSNFSKLIYDNMEMTNVNGSIIIKDQQVQLSNLKMNLLDGDMIVNGTYGTQNKNKPIVDFDLKINQFDIQKSVKTFVTLKQLAPIAESCSGKFSTGMKLNAELDQHMSPNMKTLNGGGLLNTSTITVENSTTFNKLADALKMEKLRKLVLDKVNLEFAFKDGKIEVKPFEMKVNNMKAKIGGSNYLDQTIDYTLNIEIPKNEFGNQANDVLNNMVNQAKSKGVDANIGQMINVDALIGGTFVKPTVKVSLKGAMDNVVDNIKDKAKEEVDKLKKEAEDKARAEAERLKNEAERLKNETEAKAKAEAERLKKEAEDKAKAEAERLKKEAEEKAKEELKKKLKFP